MNINTLVHCQCFFYAGETSIMCFSWQTHKIAFTALNTRRIAALSLHDHFKSRARNASSLCVLLPRLACENLHRKLKVNEYCNLAELCWPHILPGSYIRGKSSISIDRTLSRMTALSVYLTKKVMIEDSCCSLGVFRCYTCTNWKQTANFFMFFFFVLRVELNFLISFFSVLMFIYKC